MSRPIPPDRRHPLGDTPDLLISDVETPTATAPVILSTGDAKPEGSGMSIDVDLLGGVVVEKPDLLRG
jgi:hypothetical protein